MRRFRYIGSGEVIAPGPPPQILSPGDIVESSTNPDPTRYRLVIAEGTLSAPVDGVAGTRLRSDVPRQLESGECPS